MYSEGEGKPGLLDQWALCSSRPAAPLTSFKPQPTLKILFLLLPALRVGEAANFWNTDCICKTQRSMKAIKKEGREQGGERCLLPIAGARGHSPSPPASLCKTSQRSLRKGDLHLVILKLALTFFSFPRAYTEATARFYRSALTIAYRSLSSLQHDSGRDRPTRAAASSSALLGGRAALPSSELAAL